MSDQLEHFRDIAAGVIADELARAEHAGPSVVSVDRHCPPGELIAWLDFDEAGRRAAQAFRPIGGLAGSGIYVFEVDARELVDRVPLDGGPSADAARVRETSVEGPAAPPPEGLTGSALPEDGAGDDGLQAVAPPDPDPSASCEQCGLQRDRVDRRPIDCPQTGHCLHTRLAARRSVLLEELFELAIATPSRLWNGWRNGITRRHHVGHLHELAVVDLEKALESAQLAAKGFGAR